MTETPRQTAERLAAEKYNIITIDGVPTGHEVRRAYISGYLDGRTVSAEPQNVTDEDIAAERLRQVEKGWTHEHDDHHGVDHLLKLSLSYLKSGEMVKAAALIWAAQEVEFRWSYRQSKTEPKPTVSAEQIEERPAEPTLVSKAADLDSVKETGEWVLTSRDTPKPPDPILVKIDPPTVSVDQVEAGLGILAEANGEPRAGRFERTIIRAVFKAAGFRIEGEE